MQNRMKYRFGGRLGKFLAGLLVSAAVAGCVRDDTDPLAGPDAGSSGELRIAFSIDGMEAVTRAVATDPHERNLKDVHVLFFTQDGNYITYQHANVSAGSSYVSFPIPKGLTAGESYRTLVIGNAIGSAYVAMGGSANADMTYAWPGSVISPMTGEAAIQIMWKDKIMASKGDAVKAREELAAQYEAEVADGVNAAVEGLVDDVIDPADSRKMVIAALEILSSKRDSNPPKKHGNMPL